MKSISIKAKVIVVLVFSLALGAIIQVSLVRDSYNKNVAMVAQSALTTAQKTFDNIKARELSSLALASSALVNIDAVRDLFAKGDRQVLYDYVAPTFADLKSMGINIVTFLDKEGVAFLRMQTPTSFGDSTNKKITTVRKAIDSGQVAAGIDLAKPGLSRGSCRPIRDKDGSILGFLIVGGSLDQFLATMKSQTSDDYIFMGYKSFLDEKLYHATRKAKGQPDTWGQFAGAVVLATSMDVRSDPQYEKDLQSLPAAGRLLGRSESGGSTFVNGVFPLYDAANNAIGGIFVRHDITALHQGMKRVQYLAIAALVALVVVLSLVIGIVLNRLVFVRLNRTMDIVTRVVGGEFSKQIVPTAADEVGRLEELFEQFRAIFVSVVDDLSRARDEEGKKSA